MLYPLLVLVQRLLAYSACRTYRHGFIAHLLAPGLGWLGLIPVCRTLKGSSEYGRSVSRASILMAPVRSILAAKGCRRLHMSVSSEGDEGELLRTFRVLQVGFVT